MSTTTTQRVSNVHDVWNMLGNRCGHRDVVRLFSFISLRPLLLLLLFYYYYYLVVICSLLAMVSAVKMCAPKKKLFQAALSVDPLIPSTHLNGHGFGPVAASDHGLHFSH